MKFITGWQALDVMTTALSASELAQRTLSFTRKTSATARGVRMHREPDETAVDAAAFIRETAVSRAHLQFSQARISL